MNSKSFTLFAMENANNLADKLNFDATVVSGLSIMWLFNKIPNRTKITNYKGQSEYSIGEEPEFLEIKAIQRESKLVPVDLNYNKIILKDKDNTNILFIYFIVKNNKLFIYSTRNVNMDSNYFTIKVVDSNNTTKLEKSIRRTESADSINSLTEIIFGSDILELSYSDGSLVEITDIPNKGDVYNPKGISEKFRISNTGLQKIINAQIQKLQNALVLSNSQGQEMLRIEFDTLNKKILATATDAINNDQSKESQLLLFQIGSVNQRLNFGVSAKEFALHLNNTPFIIGNSFFISYYNTSNNNFKITNYPNQGENYTPRKIPSNERFQITESGLVKL